MPIYEGEFRAKGGEPGPGGLLKIGPILPGEVTIPSALAKLLADEGQQIPPPVSGFMLIDTGATRSCVDTEIVTKLGVKPIGIATLTTASGESKHNLYPAKLNFPPMTFGVEFGSLVGVNLKQQTVGGHQIIALLGRDLLSRCLLVYNGLKGSFTLAFS